MTLMSAWSDWRARRERKAQDALAEDTFNDAFGRPSERHIRRWTHRELIERIASGDLHPAEQQLAEFELRLLEQWRGPAGRAVDISIAALVVAIVSAAIAFSE